MSKFEIQHFTLCDSWINTWYGYDDQGNEVPSLFDSYEEAKQELDYFLEEEDQAFFNGDIEDRYSRDEFRIVEVKS